jgi:predicted RNA-binding Zn-ribbon protein involved in translation (DUF1610 family)
VTDDLPGTPGARIDIDRIKSDVSASFTLMCTATINGGQQCPYPAAARFQCPRGGKVHLICAQHYTAWSKSAAVGACATCGVQGPLAELMLQHYLVE